MVERSNKIVIVPQEIRGWGNVLKNKDSGNFTKYRCTINKSNSSHDGFSIPTFYIHGCLFTTLKMTALNEYYGTGTTLTVRGLLKDARNNTIVGAELKLYIDNTLYRTVHTNNNGIGAVKVPYQGNGIHTFEYRFEGDTTHDASTSGVSTVVFGVTVTTQASQPYYFLDETVSLTAFVREYYTNIDVSNVPVDFTITHVDGGTRITPTVQCTNGQATTNQTMLYNDTGYYSWKASVGEDESDVKYFYLVDFDVEFNNLLVWLASSLGIGSDNQYDSTVDLRDDFNNVLTDVNNGSISPVRYNENYERINLVLERVLYYLQHR